MIAMKFVLRGSVGNKYVMNIGNCVMKHESITWTNVDLRFRPTYGSTRPQCVNNALNKQVDPIVYERTRIKLGEYLVGYNPMASIEYISHVLILYLGF